MNNDTITPINFFSLRRIGVRLALSYALLLFMFVCVVILAVGQIQKMAKLNEQFANNDMRRLLTVQAISIATEGASNALLRLLTAEKEQRILEYASVDERNRMINGQIEKLTLTLKDDEQKQTLQRLIERKSQYHAAYVAP